MTNHVKPTTDELAANVAKAAEEAEALAPKEEEKPVAPPEVKQEGAPKEEEKPEEQQEETDYKKKFTESSREAQILYSKNKKMAEAIEKAGAVAEVTDEEAAKDLPDWDIMTDTEKRLAKDNILFKRKFSAISESTQEFKSMEAWNTKVDGFIDDPKTLIDHPELEGKVEEFKVFVTKESRRGADLVDMIGTFLFNNGKTKHIGKQIESGGASATKPNPNSDKITLDEARILRTRDYPEYKRLLKLGKIDFTV